MKFSRTWAAAAAMVALSGTAQAALVLQANGLEVLDTNTNLIWLRNWNVNGLGNWATQKVWAEGLDFAGSTDWELPEINEYAALLSAYGNLAQRVEFTNVGTGGYWSGTEFAAGGIAWLFNPVFGVQFDSQTSQFFAVAVRRGDVTASVPEPQTLALALLALGATVVARRRRSR